VPDDQNWRLKLELQSRERRRDLDRLLARVRSPEIAREAGSAISDEVAITHDGDLLFAYAASESALANARSALEAALRAERITASATVSHWDERVDEWAQVDPPLTASAKAAGEARERDEERVESRTLLATIGKSIRSDVEQTMRDGAAKLGLGCEVHEHPHLLSTQVAFTVTGPRRKLDEFADVLKEEELVTMRFERQMTLRPVL
jgi:hypothetical protein